MAAMVEAVAMQIAEQSGKEPRHVLAQTRSRALDLANEIQLDPNVRTSASAKAHHIIVELLNRIDVRLAPPSGPLRSICGKTVLLQFFRL